MEQHSLSGRWDFRLDDESAWRSIDVPGCWEQLGVRKDIAGPAWYRTALCVPPELAGKRLWLRFDAVSYHCELFVDGRAAGSHTGLWDTFEIEISGYAAPGATVELTLRVEKPAGLARGPDSARLPGRFPLRETLAGFLPYVWGQIFGGIWQDVALIATGAAVIEELAVRGTADGRVVVDAILSAPARATLEIRDPAGRSVFSATQDTERKEKRTESFSVDSVSSAANNEARFEITIPNPRPWSPQDPALYQARLRISDGDERVLRFGLRSLRADGTTILLNERPIYPRMALSWGWYHEALNSNPGRERVRADFARLKQLGYNGVKLCLWFPPQYYFDLADELGMLLWVELPMWIPQPSAFFRTQTPIEYARLMRQARNHPSVILYTLGCELNRAVDAELLAPLYAMVKAQAGDALVRDNSGSGEAYGGLLNEFADFYDYHFYSELQLFRGLLDHFTPRWRPVQPWVFGEFCDYDTFRLQIADCRLQIDTPNLQSAICNLQLPWWTSDDPTLNPQGARWIYEVVAHERRLRASGMWERGAELERISERQGLLHRKYTLELARLYREISGYVVTGEADTPISTAGMWDASGRLKFDPRAFRAFNADLVLLAGWDRQRNWAGGGDRPAPSDTWSHPAGAAVRAHLVASHYGQSSGSARVSWAIAFSSQPPFATGEITTPFELTPGSLRELAIAEFAAPHVDRPHAITLSALVRVGDEQAENAWTLWVFPRDIWRAVRNVALIDPAGRLHDFPQIAPGIDQKTLRTEHAQDKETRRQGDNTSPGLPVSLSPGLTVSPIVIATAWTLELQTFVAQGGRAVLLQSGVGAPGPLPTIELPFWREAIRLAAPHPAWRDFPLDETIGMQFFGCATDHALDLSAFDQPWSPILRRLDARTMRLHEYAAELHWGAGRLIVTTLRCEGGQGAQPLGIARNTAAAYLLWCWVTYLQEL